MRLKTFYNTILSQAYSPCGIYLIVGDVYGQISVFNLQSILTPSEGSSSTTAESLALHRKPKNSFQVQLDVQINSLLTTSNFLLVGSLGVITAYTWSNVTQNKDIQPTWKIELPSETGAFEKIEINCMIFNEEDGILHAGCSDSQIYAISIESGKILHTMNKHTDYIHSIVNQGNNLISGGEDGLVNCWDLRLKDIVHTIEPGKNSKLERPEIGKWIGAVAINDDWILCGGGPRLSIWNYRSFTMSNVYPMDDGGIHVAHFSDEKVFAGGRSPNFYQLSLNGDITSVIKTSSVSIFSAVFQKKPYKAMCLSGSSPYIDICSNFNYKDQVLTVEYDE